MTQTINRIKEIPAYSSCNDYEGYEGQTDRMYDEEQERPPKSKVRSALKGLAVSVCCLVAAIEIGMHSLCGPNGAISYGGSGNSSAGVVFIVCVIVFLASAVGTLAYFAVLLMALSDR